MTGNETIRVREFGLGEAVASETKLYKEITPKMEHPTWHIDTVYLEEERFVYNTREKMQNLEKDLLNIG